MLLLLINIKTAPQHLSRCLVAAALVNLCHPSPTSATLLLPSRPHLNLISSQVLSSPHATSITVNPFLLVKKIQQSCDFSPLELMSLKKLLLKHPPAAFTGPAGCRTGGISDV